VKQGRAFELYINGLEIANGYTELLDITEQKQRFERDNIERNSSGKQTFAIDENFSMLWVSLQGPYAGFHRCGSPPHGLLGKKRIEDVLSIGLFHSNGDGR